VFFGGEIKLERAMGYDFDNYLLLEILEK